MLHTSNAILQMILSGILPVFQIVVIANFIDQITVALSNGTGFQEVFLTTVIMLVIGGYQYIGSLLSNTSMRYIEIHLMDYCSDTLVNKISKVEYRYIEDQGTQEKIQRVSKDAPEEILKGFKNLLSFVSLVVQVIGVIIILAKSAWWAALLITFVSIPLLFFSAKSGKATYQAKMEVTGLKKRAAYISTVLTGRESAEERQLFGYAGELNRRFKENFSKALSKEIGTRIRWYIKLKFGGILVGLITILVAVVLIFPLVAGNITFGIYMSLVNGCNSLAELLSWRLTEYVDNLTRCSVFLRDMSELYQMEEETHAQDKPAEILTFQSLVFQNVSFKYPGTGKYILKNMNLKIEPGKSYGFVGPNGCGKTTVTKLLTGLYRDYEGSILLDGKELKTVSLDQLKGTFSEVFQDFAQYYISLEDNISIGNVLHEDTKALQKAIDYVSLRGAVEKLPQKEQTPLGRILDNGSDLSGGQWQRVALARVLVNPAPICILDEPTASMDPIAESRLYEEFDKLRKDRTTLFISHRLGSMRLVDHIFVITDGKVIEQGTHDELLNRKGVYAEMFDSQRKWYE